MSDLIDRQAAIDEIEFGVTYAKAINKETGEVVELFAESNNELRKAVERVKALPSAQTEVTEEAVKEYCRKRCLCIVDSALLKKYASAQPERCEDCENFSKTRLLIPQPEIILCKDCKHGVDYYDEGDCYCSNPKWGLMYFGGSWEFYCADAKRRTNG